MGEHQVKHYYCDVSTLRTYEVKIGAVGTVDGYHIDTELGLYIFVQFLKGQL